MFNNTARATRAMAVAPHHLASQSALAVMRSGGNAIEAMIAAAATIATGFRRINRCQVNSGRAIPLAVGVGRTYAASA